jgi:hypothetical protein
MLHTPDTFNMANSFFFGLKGLQLYAPTHFKVDWIDASWKYGIYNTIFSLQELLRSFIGNATNLFSPEGAIVILFVILAPGIPTWLKSANTFEKAFVLLMVAFFFWRTLSASTLYVVERYWLSLLPFVAIVASLGVAQMHSFFKGTSAKNIFTSAILILLFATSAHGISLTIRKAGSQQARYYENANVVLNAMASYVQSNTDPSTIIATTDWGVLPLFLKRSSYQMVNDDDHVMSMSRIHKYRPELLAILDENAAFPPYARKMVDDLPEAFSLVKHFYPAEGEKGPKGSIYTIDLDKVAEFLNYTGNKDSGHQGQRNSDINP